MNEKELIKYLKSLGLEVHTSTKARGHQGFYLKNRIDISKNISPEKIILDYCYTLRQLGGGIVPVSIGFSQGNRLDPLYNYLDLLICALLDCGFELVSVNEL